mgnify:CR=1 FL=1
MLEKIDELLVEVQNFQSSAKDEIEQFRIRFTGKKGVLNDFYELKKRNLRTVSRASAQSSSA